MRGNDALDVSNARPLVLVCKLNEKRARGAMFGEKQQRSLRRRLGGLRSTRMVHGRAQVGARRR